MSSYRFLQLSDLHFGRIHDPILDDLKKFILAQTDLDLVIITGDLTQRARSHQFLAARQFIESLPQPVFVIPGNHDVPLYHLFLRFFRPYHKYREAMGDWTEKIYEDSVAAVFGLWTVNRFKVEQGKLNQKQVLWLEDKIKTVPNEKIKIFACHHPPETLKEDHVQRLLALQPDVILWGHDHQSRAFLAPQVGHQVGHETSHETVRQTLMLAAGTSISSRTREEANSFNRVSIEPRKIMVEVWTHSKDSSLGFEKSNTSEFVR